MEFRTVQPSDTILMQEICKVASQYTLPHNVLGRPGAEEYVCRLSESGNWYVMLACNRVVACAHMSLFGEGDGETHSLWKIRHPMIAINSECEDALTMLVISMVKEARRLRPGSIKVVSFLGAGEKIAAQAIRGAGFNLEGVLSDYYRLGETCMILVSRSEPDDD